MLIDQEKIDQLKVNQPLTFSDALEVLKAGVKVKRAPWPIEFMMIKRPTAVADGSRRDPYFISSNGTEMNLLAIDILSDDWLIID